VKHKANLTVNLTTRQTLEAARSLAVASHGDQRYGDDAYEQYLRDVVQVLMECNADPSIPAHLHTLCAAWLHNTLEATPLEPDLIATNFGQEVLEIVLAVTEAPGENRRQRKLALYPKIVLLESAVCVTVAVRIAKIRHALRSSPPEPILRLYLNEHGEFRDALQGEVQNIRERWLLTQHLWRAYHKVMLKATRAFSQGATPSSAFEHRGVV
jgi:guanosine-3',5'-bis(diphosphate) 3'-pyrophosphohydrolase